MQNGAATPNQTEQLLHFGKWGFEVINPTPAPAMVCVARCAAKEAPNYSSFFLPPSLDLFPAVTSAQTSTRTGDDFSGELEQEIWKEEMVFVQV